MGNKDEMEMQIRGIGRRLECKKDGELRGKRMGIERERNESWGKRKMELSVCPEDMYWDADRIDDYFIFYTKLIILLF